MATLSDFYPKFMANRHLKHMLIGWTQCCGREFDGSLGQFEDFLHDNLNFSLFKHWARYIGFTPEDISECERELKAGNKKEFPHGKAS